VFCRLGKRAGVKKKRNLPGVGSKEGGLDNNLIEGGGPSKGGFSLLRAGYGG